MFLHSRTTALIAALPFMAASFASGASSAEDRSMGRHSAPSSAAEVVSGGVGMEAREQLRQRAEDYELKLVFAATPSGDYLAEIPVTITDRRGNKVVEAVSEGPWMYVELPSGAYTVRADHAGQTQTRQVSVRAGSQRTLYVRFSDRRDAMSMGSAPR